MTRATIVLGLALCACSQKGAPTDAPANSSADLGSSAGGTTTLCHVPKGNPANAHTIEVGTPAVKAHLAHGDTLGPCAGAACVASGDPCSALEPCCSGLCESGACGAAPQDACMSNGTPCTNGAECCTGHCATTDEESGSMCADDPACTQFGDPCGTDADCCTGLCGTAGACENTPDQCRGDCAPLNP